MFEVRENLERRWNELTQCYLPLGEADSKWRFSRNMVSEDPSQGWKLHVSATLLEACDVLERVGPYLTANGVLFKAPESLDELQKINCGLNYGYHQVGKFITVYPSSSQDLLNIAASLHRLTEQFVPIDIPFDNRFSSDSSVFYRYGAFRSQTLIRDDGSSRPAICKPDGSLTQDDRMQAVPEWMENPFSRDDEAEYDDPGPLCHSYRVFGAISQRGKGGTYLAVDVTGSSPRFCVVKEGRRYGEIHWNGQDGFSLLNNEIRSLQSLSKINDITPAVYDSFETGGNLYAAMEYIEGKSLYELMRFRRRRFSIRKVLELSIEIAAVIEKIDAVGWVWNDCKPANLILTEDGRLRPVDFENSHLKGQPTPFEWKSAAFSMADDDPRGSGFADLYSLGTVMFFLLTGKIFDSKEMSHSKILRRGAPQGLIDLIKSIVLRSKIDKVITVPGVKLKLENVLKEFNES